MRALALRAKAIGRAARVKPTALLIVVPDDHAEERSARRHRARRGRGPRAAVAARECVREGLPGSAHLGGTEVMEVRSRLQAVVRFA